MLGLVLNVFEVTRLVMRLTADKSALQTRYPIYFVVKHPCLRVAAPAEPWGS
jgi:hypothetical protein